jgi:hypothetical protein
MNKRICLSAYRGEEGNASVEGKETSEATV